MRLHKWALTGLTFASLALAPALAPSTVLADTSGSYTMASTHIKLDGQSISNPRHVVAQDPWGNSQTTWVPIFYLQQALKQVGFETTWDGTNLTFTKYPSNWNFPVALGNPEATPVKAPKGQMQISLVDGGPPSMNFPKIVAQDPASQVDTTYVPIYYVDTALQHYFDMGASWNGINNTWTLTSQSTIAQQDYPSSTAAANQIAQIQKENTYLPFEPGSNTVDLGLGITARQDAGMSHDGLQWHEGNWTVEVLWFAGNQGGEQLAKNVVSYLHTNMLPPPHSSGVIIIRSTNGNSAALTPSTLIAWQEGSTVYQLKQAGDPILALQTVVSHGKQTAN